MHRPTPSSHMHPAFQEWAWACQFIFFFLLFVFSFVMGTGPTARHTRTPPMCASPHLPKLCERAMEHESDSSSYMQRSTTHPQLNAHSCQLVHTDTDTPTVTVAPTVTNSLIHLPAPAAPEYPTPGHLCTCGAAQRVQLPGPLGCSHTPPERASVAAAGVHLPRLLRLHVLEVLVMMMMLRPHPVAGVHWGRLLLLPWLWLRSVAVAGAHLGIYEPQGVQQVKKGRSEKLRSLMEI